MRELAGALVDNAYQVLAVSYFVADREVERLGASADEVHRRLIVMVLIATALALAAALALTRLIARPIAEIDAAIRQLGGADFERPIRVHGPEDLQSLGERLDWLRRRLIELEAQKNRFLRHLSHDLKTPLAALREGTELLNDQVAGPLAPPQRQVVAIMRDNSVKLQRLIEELLDYQRALHAASGLQVGAVGLDVLLRQSIRSHQLAAQAKSQRVELDAHRRSRMGGCREAALGDRQPAWQRGQVHAVWRRNPRAGARRAAVPPSIDVVDSGPGVPPEEREAIFEAFFRGRAGAFGRAEGTGLGLAIAREFTEAHGGRIEVVAGARGGHFRVTLPVRPAATACGGGMKALAFAAALAAGRLRREPAGVQVARTAARAHRRLQGGSGAPQRPAGRGSRRTPAPDARRVAARGSAAAPARCHEGDRARHPGT